MALSMATANSLFEEDNSFALAGDWEDVPRHLQPDFDEEDLDEEQ